MTYKSVGITAKVPDTFVEVSAELAAERGLVSGDWVRLTSRRGSIELRALLSDRVTGHELYVPNNSSTAPVNFLTASVVDPDSDTPVYKETAVKLTPLNRRGAPPLPETNPRYGHPTPQPGVEVERKWERPDYVSPTRNRPEGGNL